MKPLLAIVMALTFFACNKNDDNTIVVSNPETPGLAYSLSSLDFNTTYTSLRSSLQSNPAISILAEVNHTANAQGIGQTLPNTRVIVFGNPALGTSLMQTNQLAGLDLPQKMLVYQNADNNVFVAYNTTSYLASRHGVGGASTIQDINTALNNIASGVTDATVSENSSASITQGEGVITLVSQNNFIDTYNTLRNAISDNLDLTIIEEVNHQENAQAANLTLNPTRLIIFGNPNAGTPLMQNAQITGIDLPQKMLVWQEADGTVNISYNDPEYIAQRHNITGNEMLLTNINNLLVNLALDAAN